MGQVGCVVMVIGDVPRRNNETPRGHSKYPRGVPGVLMSVPLPLPQPVSTLTHDPPGVPKPLSFPRGKEQLGEGRTSHAYSTEGWDSIPYCVYYSLAHEGQVQCRFCHLALGAIKVWGRGTID